MDVYVWSIEDTHAVRVEAYGYCLEVAMFAEIQLARNFRDWLAALDGLETLMQDIQRDPCTLSYAGICALNTITNRRIHPAQLRLTGYDLTLA